MGRNSDRGLWLIQLKIKMTPAYLSESSSFSL